MVSPGDYRAVPACVPHGSEPSLRGLSLVCGPRLRSCEGDLAGEAVCEQLAEEFVKGDCADKMRHFPILVSVYMMVEGSWCGD